MSCKYLSCARILSLKNIFLCVLKHLNGTRVAGILKVYSGISFLNDLHAMHFLWSVYFKCFWFSRSNLFKANPVIQYRSHVCLCLYMLMNVTEMKVTHSSYLKEEKHMLREGFNPWNTRVILNIFSPTYLTCSHLGRVHDRPFWTFSRLPYLG